jgi:hypothetical protein
VEKFIDEISKAPKDSRITTISRDPDYLKKIAESIRDYAGIKRSKTHMQKFKVVKNS